QREPRAGAVVGNLDVVVALPDGSGLELDGPRGRPDARVADRDLGTGVISRSQKQSPADAREATPSTRRTTPRTGSASEAVSRRAGNVVNHPRGVGLGRKMRDHGPVDGEGGQRRNT